MGKLVLKVLDFTLKISRHAYCVFSAKQWSKKFKRPDYIYFFGGG